MINPHKGESDLVLRRLKKGSEERFRIQLFEAIRMLLDDFDMTWKELAAKVSIRTGGDTLRAYVGHHDLDIVELNEIAHVFSAEPYIIFRPRKPYTQT